MRLRLLREAEDESRKAANWYAQSQEELGGKFLEAVAAALGEIESDPLRFAKIERPRTKREIRRHRLKRFPYSIIYERIDSEFIVLAVAHAKQRSGYWLKRNTASE